MLSITDGAGRARVLATRFSVLVIRCGATALLGLTLASQSSAAGRADFCEAVEYLLPCHAQVVSPGSAHSL